MSENNMEEQVLKALEDIRPNLQMDGGDVEFIGLENNIAKLRLVGACGSCPSSTYTLKMGIETHLKDQVPELEGVEAV